MSHTGTIGKAEVNVKLSIESSAKGKVNSILMNNTSEQCWVHEKKEVEESQYLTYE